MIFSVLIVLNSFQSISLIERQKKAVHIRKITIDYVRKVTKKEQLQDPRDSRLLCKNDRGS